MIARNADWIAGQIRAINILIRSVAYTMDANGHRYASDELLKAKYPLNRAEAMVLGINPDPVYIAETLPTASTLPKEEDGK